MRQNIKVFPKPCFVALATLLLACVAAMSLCSGQRPNCIIIMTDDQSYRNLGFFEAPTIQMPNIDAMALRHSIAVLSRSVVSRRLTHAVLSVFALSFFFVTQPYLSANHRMRLIEEVFECSRVTSTRLDHLLAYGWRHFGTTFYRYNFSILRGEPHVIIPLRLAVQGFAPRKSQRRVIRNNADTRTVVRLASVTPVKEAIFSRHAETRFVENRPTSLYDFVSRKPQSVPCTCMNVDIFLGDRLIASSFLDMGKSSVSSIYASFDPEFSDRSLGVYTALEEIRFARECGKRHYYLGYGTYGPSFYDYKKRIGDMEGYDWSGNWLSLKDWQLPV